MCFNVFRCSKNAVQIFTMFFVVFFCAIIFCRIFAVLVIFLCKTNNFIVHYSCTFIYPLHHYNALHFIKNVTFKITHIVNKYNVTLFVFFIRLFNYVLQISKSADPPRGSRPCVPYPLGEVPILFRFNFRRFHKMKKNYYFIL